MTDPFRAELTAEYLVRENHSWAANERLARTARPRGGVGTLLASIASLFARDARPETLPELRMMPRRERPAA